MENVFFLEYDCAILSYSKKNTLSMHGKNKEIMIRNREWEWYQNENLHDELVLSI